jgi:hypothetical protein
VKYRGNGIKKKKKGPEVQHKPWSDTQNPQFQILGPRAQFVHYPEPPDMDREVKTTRQADYVLRGPSAFEVRFTAGRNGFSGFWGLGWMVWAAGGYIGCGA